MIWLYKINFSVFNSKIKISKYFILYLSKYSSPNTCSLVINGIFKNILAHSLYDWLRHRFHLDLRDEKFLENVILK